ncbi:MAG: recombinase family protein [Thermoplasmata archaeon]|jgi:DNA invertase Pin-like site-specific DNA recombinase|nr:recombinase family protein [Thermoplasmata archaeon]
MRAALYARVSTEDQAVEGYSLDAQVMRMEAYCRVRGWEVAGVYRDEGYSGRNAHRPEYSRMMDEIDSWDTILVLKMDRIHRNSLNFTVMMNDLKAKGKDFNSMQDKFDTTTAMGRFVMSIMQGIAQLESEQTGERVKMGMSYKAQSTTGSLGSGHPYGYRYEDGRLLVEEDEAHVVRAIYNMSNEGYTLGKITDSLNDAGIPAKKGGKWNRQSVSNVLHNPLYIGLNRWDGNLRKGEQDPIVDRAVYEAINGPVDID